jgi:hypothetical protein
LGPHLAEEAEPAPVRPERERRAKSDRVTTDREILHCRAIVLYRCIRSTEERDVFAIFTALLLGTAASRLPSKLVLLHDPVFPDLPCPWCRSATFEDDPNCPSCGQHFG